MSDYADLTVWNKSMNLVTKVYSITRTFPDDERFGLTSQMRRCAVSIPSNIAEGTSRKTSKDFSRFLIIAKGSTSELETQVRISVNLNFISESEYTSTMEDLTEISKMLSGLIRSIN